MPHILFLTLHRPDRAPGQRFRFEQYVEFLEQNGFSTSHSFLLDQRDDKNFYAPGKVAAKSRILLRSVLRRINEAFFSRPPDIVFVQRECFMLGTAFFEKRFSRRSKLIFDFDDSIWLQNVSDANRRFGFLKNPRKTQEIIGLADLVVAGNDYLARFAKRFNERVMIMPTTIDTGLYTATPVRDKEVLKIGWSGSFSTIKHFEESLPALGEIKRKHGQSVEFLVIGDGNYRNQELGIEGQPWRLETEVADLRQIDIGIMPLPDDEWSKGKCALKGLQYMALGIPTVMSPVGVNKDVIVDGVNGFLASDSDEWIDKLNQLVTSYELRKRLGENGRVTVLERYSVAANKDRFLEMMEGVLQDYPAVSQENSAA